MHWYEPYIYFDKKLFSLPHNTYLDRPTPYLVKVYKNYIRFELKIIVSVFLYYIYIINLIAIIIIIMLYLYYIINQLCHFFMLGW